MHVVLGIDAAWTDVQPSGVAVIILQGDTWRLTGAASCYEEFCVSDKDSWRPDLRPRGSVLNAAQLLAAAEASAGDTPTLVAVDMPLAREPIVSRRCSDNTVSREFGARGCGTHTPNPQRPGRISDRIRSEFDALGYPLATSQLSSNCLIEVYPHPALMVLADADYRLPYKVSKSRVYWPKASKNERAELLVKQWRLIVELLAGRIEGVEETLALPEPDWATYWLKAFEDRLDAVVCAWVGMSVVEGEARPLGDTISAIWVPGSRREAGA
jgi:predicted RNase H-like nuclease